MLRFLKFFFIISIIFNNAGVAKSENLSLAYVDVDIIINNSNAGKKFFNEINQSIQKKKKEFDQIESDLKSKENEILKQKNILSEKDLNNRIKELRLEINEFNNQKKKFNNQINNKRLIGSKDLLKSLHKILTDYASENQLSLILQKKNIIIGKTNLDITKSIMEIFNKKVKKVNLS